MASVARRFSDLSRKGPLIKKLIIGITPLETKKLESKTSILENFFSKIDINIKNIPEITEIPKAKK